MLRLSSVGIPNARIRSASWKFGPRGSGTVTDSHNLTQQEQVAKMEEIRGLDMKKLDWSRLLGFEQIVPERAGQDRVSDRVDGKTTILPAKIGDKVGTKL